MREQYLRQLKLPCGKSVVWLAPNSWKKLTGCALEKALASDPDLLPLELWLTLRSGTFYEVISSSQPDNRSLFKKKKIRAYDMLAIQVVFPGECLSHASLSSSLLLSLCSTGRFSPVCHGAMKLRKKNEILSQHPTWKWPKCNNSGRTSLRSRASMGSEKAR